jgi:hypothetical protein
MLRKVIVPHTKEDLLIQIPEKFINTKMEILVFPVDTSKDTDFEKVEGNTDRYLSQLSNESFSDIWETPENDHWDEFLKT